MLILHQIADNIYIVKAITIFRKLQFNSIKIFSFRDFIIFNKSYHNTFRKNITPELLATFWDYAGIEYVIDEYGKWLLTAGDIAKKYNYSILELFNWEERNGNLYTAFQVDKDIAQEEFTPYNCRRLMEVFLSVPNKYRDIHTNVYFRAMMKHLWPELVTIPFNPNLEKYTSYYLKKIGLYWTIRRFTRGW